MFQLYRRIKWLYQAFHLSLWLPFLTLISYTVIGAFIFQALERDRDETIRENYRNRTDYALNQVLERMLEVRCHDVLIKTDKMSQIHHAKEALYWFLDHLNLTQVIDERTDDTPWTWLGSMFYAGQLYTTIGYGYPTTQTTGGRVASIFYILFGIPIFLIILKDMGQLLSRGLRKLYKRMGASKRKIVEVTPIKTFPLPLIGNTDKTKKNNEDRRNGMLEEKEELQSHYHEKGFPIPIALSILLLWIMFSASLFCIWEHQWGFLTSVYFFFVSISTVGLGDIVFSNPDMMLFNFILILIGLALLSMCFNLIQASLERLLDRLLEEYIEEIEKMAEIVANEECLEEEAIPLEFKMTGNLLTLPMKKVTHDSGLFAEAKGWMAGRIAENLLASRLGPMQEDSDSEIEEEVKINNETTLENGQTESGRSMNENGRRKSSKLTYNMGRYRFHRNRPLFNTIRTLDKIKPQQGDFRGMIFSKFIQSERLNRLVDEGNTKGPMMVTTSCQTDSLPTDCSYPDFERLRKGRRWRNMRKGLFIKVSKLYIFQDSNSSYSTVYTNSMMVDDESLLSAAYCDLKFDYSTEVTSPILNMRSTLSIFKVDDEEPMLASEMLKNRMSSYRSPPQVRLNSNLNCVKERLSPSLHKMKNRLQHFASDSNLKFNKVLKAENSNEEALERICGLLPKDFENISSSRNSAMADSGYDKSTEAPDLTQKTDNSEDEVL